MHGKVLLSQYLNFTEPVALETLSKLDNLEVRIATTGSMHAKGYYFTDSNCETFIIGSSNWTASALSTNTELNVLIKAQPNSGLAKEVSTEFDRNFFAANPLTKQFIAEYTTVFEHSRRIRDASWFASDEETTVSESPAKTYGMLGTQYDRFPIQRLEPNKMQAEAIESLEDLQKNGKAKALVISATGTGKTLLSAFHARKRNVRSLLFIVHRENIARAAMESYRKVFGNTRRLGMYTGNCKELDAEFIFSTVQTISRPSHLEQFSPNRFEYIIVDESHRMGSNSYRTFLDHFSPSFLLGMTATPERTDGADIFRFFDYTIAYEIRLQRALEEGMLSPFHYYGVTDIHIDDEHSASPEAFCRLTASERVNRIVEKAEFYGCYNGIVRGLIFCSRIDEARKLSWELNARGYRTVALDGSSTEFDRESAIERLEAPSTLKNKLDYILTVDIFNEGVDIPSVNQIILLRPTTSAIVFVQQLGRGLRKIADPNKYLTVIDFIGNYGNNYLIPIALYGDRSYDKDRLRRLMFCGDFSLPGTCTVDFDKVSKERIFRSLNVANTQLARDLRTDFEALQLRVGRAPLMMDFLIHDARDPAAFVSYSKSFYNFSRMASPDLTPQISERARKLLEALSYDSFNGKSLEEALLLQMLLAKKSVEKIRLETLYQSLTGTCSQPGRWESAFRSVNLRFIRESLKQQLVFVGEKLGVTLLSSTADTFERGPDFDPLLNEPGLAKYLQDLSTYSRSKFLRDFDCKYFHKGFYRYRKYRRADVFRILGASENPVAQNVGGYQISPDRSWCPLFVTYQKREQISATTQYDDKFISPSQLKWFTKSRRNLKSPDVLFFQSLTQKQRVLLFVQKSNDEGLEFYYIGDVFPNVQSISQTYMRDNAGKETPVVTMTLDIDIPVEQSLYRYITETDSA